MNTNISISKNQNRKLCEMCGREKELTFHHFIPKTCHRNKWFKKNFTKEEMKKSGMDVCHDCHHFIHKTYPEKELGRNFNSREKLIADPKIRKFLKWVRKQK